MNLRCPILAPRRRPRPERIGTTTMLSVVKAVISAAHFTPRDETNGGQRRFADNDLSAAGSEFLRPLIDLMREGADLKALADQEDRAAAARAVSGAEPG